MSKKIYLLISSLCFLLLTSCHSPKADKQTIHIMIINPVIIESNNKHTADEVCQQWQLNAQQIKQFFQISERYLNYPYNSYYQIPCKITGTLKAYGIIWKFTIEGSATGFWQ